MGLHDKVLVVGGCRAGFCEKALGAPPHQKKPVGARSKMDPQLAKAEAISDAGDSSVVIYLSKRKTHYAAAAREELLTVTSCHCGE